MTDTEQSQKVVYIPVISTTHDTEILGVFTEAQLAFAEIDKEVGGFDDVVATHVREYAVQNCVSPPAEPESQEPDEDKPPASDESPSNIKWIDTVRSWLVGNEGKYKLGGLLSEACNRLKAAENKLKGKK